MNHEIQPPLTRFSHPIQPNNPISGPHFTQPNRHSQEIEKEKKNEMLEGKWVGEEENSPARVERRRKKAGTEAGGGGCSSPVDVGAEGEGRGRGMSGRGRRKMAPTRLVSAGNGLEGR